PITGTVLIMEMTGSYQQLLSLAIAAMVAFVVAELCHSKPIYEELLHRSLNAAQPRPEVLKQRNLVELSVCDGSELAHKMLKDIHWPPRVLVIEIRRGEEQITPNGDALIMPGDFIYVLAENGVAVELQNMAGAEKLES
ncbi:MAG: ClC family H(+)/Cl(-) exchange transporter, partial [Phascolarctobacterium sp.]|nr:ClC family H(+)/Cl(-) exchange transporter [Phascolarctobacterium sp.]